MNMRATEQNEDQKSSAIRPHRLLPAKRSLLDEKESNKLRVWIQEQFGLSSSVSATPASKEVLLKLQITVKDWVQKVAARKHLPLDVAAKAGGAIFTSGSYRLGVHSANSDVDALCIVPYFVERDADFFGELFAMLRADPDVSALQDIKEAHVPLIKMKLGGVDVDLLFARVRYESVQAESLDLGDDRILIDCDEKTVHSMNACRNNDRILEVVPDPESFRLVLLCVKQWAKKRDLYCNKLGYLGGISWAVLVAKVCQLFPGLPPNRLIEKFFKVFARWDWKVPVLLCDIREPKGINITVQNWNPRARENDMQHLMPIITPAFPCINSAFNVSHTTLSVIRRELVRAAKVAGRINSRVEGYAWPRLFARYELFSKYRRFIRVDVISGKKEHMRWVGFVESKLRLLVLELEQLPQIRRLRPYTKAFAAPSSSDQCSSTFFFGVKFAASRDEKRSSVVDLREPVQRFVCTIESMSGFTLNPSLKLQVRQTTIEDVPKGVLADEGWKGRKRGLRLNVPAEVGDPRKTKVE